KTIKEAIESIQGVAGRFEQVEAGQDYAVIVDYAHTPDSLQNVLKTVEEFAERKIYVVVGTAGTVIKQNDHKWRLLQQIMRIGQSLPPIIREQKARWIS